MSHSLAGGYLFCLGLATGMTGLVMTAYRGVSPRWLKWLLWASGIFVASRYLAMALSAIAPQTQEGWLVQRCRLATSVGLTLPGVVAVDQLVRHPAMSPKKLLRWFSPFLIAYALVLGVGRANTLLIATQAVFIAGFLWIGGLLIKKLPHRPTQLALGLLMAAYASLGLEGLLVASGRWHMPSYLWSETLILAALWFAFDTAKQHPL